MHHKAILPVRKGFGKGRRQERRSRTGDDGVRSGKVGKPGKDALLDLQVFRRALLNMFGAGHGVFEGRHNGHSGKYVCRRLSGQETLFGQCRKHGLSERDRGG